MQSLGWCLRLLLATAALAPPAHARKTDPLVRLLETELRREMKALSSEEVPPYYIGYTVRDAVLSAAGASFGSLTGSHSSRRRTLSVTVRVGDYARDNTHELRGSGTGFVRAGGSSVALPLDDDPVAIRAVVWRETNKRYREAVEQLARVKANVAVKVTEEDRSADFSREAAPVVHIEPPLATHRRVVELGPWDERTKKYSAPFLGHEAIFIGQASFTFASVRKTMVTSEGTRLAHNLSYARLYLNAVIKSDDGMELPLATSYFAFEPDGLPRDTEVLARARLMTETLAKLRDSDVATPYTGPALLSGRAAAVFFHEILGHRIEGHRQKSEEEGQTFKTKLGQAILPKTIGVTFDPTLQAVDEQQLAGHYRFDDEGVHARPVPVVEKGILKTFLMSRRPIEQVPVSNGHGRAQDGFTPVARQSSMMVTTEAPVREAELRRRLLAEIKAQGKEYGLYFRDIQGGFTFTGRWLPNAFNLLPIEVYKVFADGTPDLLIRGVDLVGTPLVMFSMIEAVGDRREVFNGMCGAESGSVPVAAAAPAMLIKQVEVQRKPKSQERPPLLPRPDADKAGTGRSR